ncbi:MAG: hypothetical protein O3A53_15890 [Acidobacteria bacterium]|nr:hypothetical protein [Acidobacteriota bacterium]
MPLRREASWSVVPELKLISVQGPQGAVEAIERLLQEVDVPGPEDATSVRLNVVFTGYLVGASDAGESQIPEQVRDAVVELGKHFPYKNYSLLETFGIRTQVGGSAEVSGVTTTAPDQPAMRYEVEIQVGDVSETETRKVVRIRALRSQWRLPIETKPDVFVYEEPGLRASLDIPEDVIVVVGKSGSVGAYQGIFLLLKAEVVEP